eukprot:5641338-Pleurochrysis_carterae.AAC.2
MIGYFCSLRLSPADPLFRHCLFARFRVLQNFTNRKRAACAAPPCRLASSRTKREHGCTARTQGIISERTFEGAGASGCN